MWAWLWAKLLSRVFGDGIGADIAGRGAVYLAQEARKAVERDEVRLTRVRLRPGETYTVVARPPATRSERRLAARQRGLRARELHLAHPSRRQLRTARKLQRAQRHLDRRRPGTRRHRRAAEREAEVGRRFDRVMRPSRRQVAVHRELAAVTEQLDASREVRFRQARAQVRSRPQTVRSWVQRTRVFD